MGVKRSRAYLEQEWLPFLGRHAPVLDVGKAAETSHYRALVGTDRYVTIDVDAATGPDIVADITTPDVVALARQRHREYGSILFNGVVGYGVDAPAQLDAAARHFHELLGPGGHLLVGWNEWEIDRAMLFEILIRHEFENLPIARQPVVAPPETEGYEHLKHRYTHWRKV